MRATAVAWPSESTNAADHTIPVAVGACAKQRAESNDKDTSV